MAEIEYLDVLTEQGELTGQKLDRNEVHRLGLWHRVIHVWLINSKGEMVIQKRHRTKVNFPSLWDISAAGHCSAGDSSKTAAVRELEEELGVYAQEAQLNYVFTGVQKHILNNGTYLNNEHVDVYYMHTDVKLSDLKLQENEVEEVKSVHYQDLEKILNSKDATFVPVSPGWEEKYRTFFALLASKFPAKS